MMRISIVALAACHGSASPRHGDEPIAPPGPVAVAAPAPAPAIAAPDGRDLPGPLYAGMFTEDASFAYTVRAYKVDKLGERHGGDERLVKCLVTDVVYLDESRALSARLSCDEPGALNGVMFATRDGFWWYDQERYTAGGFAIDESTKVLDREPREIHEMEDRVYAVQHTAEGWCWSEAFDRPWDHQGLCFADGRLVSGWASNDATAKTKGDHVEFRLAP